MTKANNVKKKICRLITDVNIVTDSAATDLRSAVDGLIKAFRQGRGVQRIVVTRAADVNEVAPVANIIVTRSVKITREEVS